MNGKKYLVTAASILLCIALFFFIITFSIGLPIYVRPFYYAHIKPMELADASGYTGDEIIAAYNEVLDYLTLPGKDFSAGEMKYSEEGAAHFADCKVLFDLNVSVLLASLIVICAIKVLERIKGFKCRLCGHRPAFFAGIAAVVLPVVIGALAATDFDRAFVVFHSLFFPGKDNWIFDPRTDEIINVLPQDFFMHCAILIGAGVIILSASFIIYDIVNKKQKRS